MQYRALVELYESISKTSKRLEKTHLISEFLKTVPVDDLPAVVLMLQGRVFPIWVDKNIGMASQFVLRCLNVSTGVPIVKIEQLWKEIGDLGEVAQKAVKEKTQATLFATPLSIGKVFGNLRKLPEVEGAGSVDMKVKIVSELFTSATPLEAKYLTRAVIEDLRVGVGVGHYAMRLRGHMS